MDAAACIAEAVAIAEAYHRVLLDAGVELHQLYLFGSHVRGEATADSDIDIAIVLAEDDYDDVDITYQFMKLRRVVDWRIEPHVFNRTEFAEYPFGREIVLSGRLIAA